MFKYTVEGNAIVGSKIKQLKWYEAEFELAEECQGMALSIIQNTLIKPYLLKTIDDCRGFHTCTIQKREAVAGDLSDEDLELEQLIAEATELSCLPETLSGYEDTKGKAKLIKGAITRRKNKLKKLEEAKDGIKDEGYVE